MTEPTYVPPGPATGRRKAIYRAGLVAALAGAGGGWLLVVLGVLPATPTDDVVSALMFPLLFVPFAALWDNPGETRTHVQRLAEFSFGWLLVSGIAQTTWELPWFLFDLTGLVHGIGPEDTWLWPWWAYGVADTRYLTSSPVIAGLEFCAGIAGPFELYACWLFARGRRIPANWIALLLGTGLSWATVVFFYAEVHVGFANIQDGAFGFWVKWLGLNLPWAVAPFCFVPASILELRELYRQEGIEAYLAGRGDAAVPGPARAAA